MRQTGCGGKSLSHSFWMTHSSYPILCQTALEESNHTEDISVYHLPFLASLPRRLETLHICQGTVLTQSILQHYLLSLEYILIISTNQKQAYLQQLCPNTFPECLPEMTSPFLASSAHRAFGRTLCFASLTGLCCDFSESMIYKTRKLIKYFKCSKYHWTQYRKTILSLQRLSLILTYFFSFVYVIHPFKF